MCCEHTTYLAKAQRLLRAVADDIVLDRVVWQSRIANVQPHGDGLAQTVNRPLTDIKLY